MARVEWDAVGKRYGDTEVLRSFTLAAGDGELLTILGPSGCGKSTLLRMTAGLETLSDGKILLNGRRIDRLAPSQRDVAMVFQSYALYPHLSVGGNIEFPLRMRGIDAAERRRQAREVAELLELGELLDRKPSQLSGGQRQRVALARAVVRRPQLFLLDEPLSNLDARLRLSVRQYLRDLQRRLGITTVYVTHDQTEAMTLGDRMVVMSDGRIHQVGAPDAVYERPANAFVAGFIGNPPMNLFRAQCVAGQARFGSQALPLPVQVQRRGGVEVMVGVRPESLVASAQAGLDDPEAQYDVSSSHRDVSSSHRDVSETHRDALIVTPVPGSSEVLGSETLVRGDMEGQPVTARLPGLVRDIPPRLVARLETLHWFDAGSGERFET